MATSQPQPEPLAPSGYLRYLVDLYSGSADTTLRLDEDQELPPDDAPWSVLQEVRFRSA